MLTTTGFRTPVFEAKTNKQKVYIYIYTHTPFICAILQHQNITHRIHGTEIFSYINHRFMGIFMSVNSSLPRRPMVFMKTEASSLGRGVPWMSWVGSMKSTPQGCTGGRGLSGWMDFFLQASNQGSTSRNSWDPQDSNLGGSRLVTFFLFSSFLWTLFGFISIFTDLSPQKIPKKVIRIIEIVALCFFFLNSQEVGTLLKPVCFFFSNWFPKKVEDH